MPLAEAKERLTLPVLWRLLGWPGEPGRECYCPYRPEDRRKSCSIIPGSGDLLFKDFKSGEVYDGPGLLAQVENISNGDACRRFIELASGSVSSNLDPVQRTVRRPRNLDHIARNKPVLPYLKVPSRSDLERISELRKVSVAGVKFAADLGFLFVAQWRGVRCWAITDSSRWNCQFRRMDGKPFLHLEEPKKTLGATGSWASWPIGICDLNQCENLLLVEGSGDFVAGWHFIVEEGETDRCGVVCMTGASNWIPSQCLPALGKSRIRIFPHLDCSGAGENAGLRWETQLAAFGADVHCFDLGGLVKRNGEAVGDLNDLVEVDERDLRNLGNLTKY